MSQNEPAHRCDGAKHTNIGKLMNRELNAFYREMHNNLSTDSEGSSRLDSICNDSDYQTIPKYSEVVDHNCQNSHDEIADKLSKLKIGYNNNLNSDSGTTYDVTSKDDSKFHSIIAGKSPADIHHDTVQSLPDSKCSTVLAGRLNSRDDVHNTMDEQSLLNIAMNESMEINVENYANAVELSRFVDSLDVQKEESDLNERDSLEAGDSCTESKSENHEVHNPLFHNNENTDPNLLKTQRCGLPKIISDEIVKSPILMRTQTPKKMSLSTKSDDVVYLKLDSKYKSDREKSSAHTNTTQDRYTSAMTEGEKMVLADVKTPSIEFNEEKSPCKFRANADTFDSDFITDISNLSSLDAGGGVVYQGKRAGTNRSREKIFKRFSQQFAEAPTKFTEKLIALVEESVLDNSKAENLERPGVNLSRLTEEFRKLCGLREIKDESAPELASGTWSDDSNSSISQLGNDTQGDAAASPFHNFSKLGGGKKVYRKTPLRVFQTNTGSGCNTPHCANIIHQIRNNNRYSPRAVWDLDNSMTVFNYWERFCYEKSPSKQARSQLSHVRSSDVPTREDLIRKENEQMALLDQSSPMDNNEKKNTDAGNYNSSSTSKEHQDQDDDNCNKNSTNDLSRDNNHNQMKQILTNRLIKKRRKCFEEARKVFETMDNTNKNFNDKNVSSGDCDNEARFINTLSACVEYFENINTLQNHKNALQIIMECSENSESVRENLNDSSKPIEYVEAVIIPIKNRAKYQLDNPEIQMPDSPHKNKNLVAETCLYIPGTPTTPNQRPLSESPERYSPPQRLSPKVKSSVLSTKIKKSSLSAKKSNLQTAKPASHSITPQTSSKIPPSNFSGNELRSLKKSNPCYPSINKLKSAAESPGLTNVTNIKKSNDIPKITLINSSPTCKPLERSGRMKNSNMQNINIDCQRQLHFTETDTSELEMKKKYFGTPESSSAVNKVRSKKKYFATPGRTPLQNRLPVHSPGSHIMSFNTVQSPVGMYIRGTNPNLIKNVRSTANEKMLTPRAKKSKPKSKGSSPILARSPRLSPISTESSRLKFQLTSAKKHIQYQECDILNMALCESDFSSNIESENTSNTPFPKIFYKPASCVEMVKDNEPQSRCPKILAPGIEEKNIYHHGGRVKSTTESKIQKYSTPSETTEDSMSRDSGDISLLHQKPAVKSNYIMKKL